jgi:hypothetical protein
MLKELLSNRALKKGWRYFWKLLVKFKDKEEFIRMERSFLLSFEPQSEWKISVSQSKLQSYYRGLTIEIQYRTVQ